MRRLSSWIASRRDPRARTRAMKELVNRRAYADLHGQLEAEADQQKAMGKSTDFIEGVTAFAQKRKPDFTGS